MKNKNYKNNMIYYKIYWKKKKNNYKYYIILKYKKYNLNSKIYKKP